MAIFNSREMQLLHLRWYDHWLKGNDTGFMDEDPVTVFVRNREVYRPEKDWPLPQTQYRNLYLAPGPSGGVAVAERRRAYLGSADGRAEPAPPAYAGSAGSGPAGTMRRPRTAWAPEDDHGRGRDQGHRHAELHQLRLPRPGLVAFLRAGDGSHGGRGAEPGTEDPHLRHRALAEDLEVIGNIVLNLWASSDQTDTDFFVRLTDQLPGRRAGTGHAPARPHAHAGLAEGLARLHQG